MADSQKKPVLIIGGGVVGLSLAHGLAKAGIPFEIFERDTDTDARDQGWAITLHWCLPFLRNLLTPEALALVEDSQVDPEVAKNDTGNFLFLNIANLETKFRIPPNDRRRVSRTRFRNALLQDERVGGHVHWGRKLKDIAVNGDTVTASFEDGTSVEGSLLIGAEGSNSRTRQFVAPETYHNQPLDVKFLGAAVDMTPEQVKPLRDIDPLLFQGCHPDTNDFLWISMLDTPATNGSAGTSSEYYKVQIALSWPVKTPQDTVMPDTDAARATEIKRRAANFHPVLRDAVALLDETEEGSTAREILLQDWPCLPWDYHGGLVTLIGDAAHAMTMYRGEAANHGIKDAYHLAAALDDVYSGRKSKAEALAEYEAEMRERTSVAVLWSREACIGAHDYHNLDEKSAVLRRRAINMPQD